MAYQVRDFQLTGTPPWASSEKYDVTAKPNAAHSQSSEQPIERSLAQMHLMLQTLLADHFKLKLHRETRELPVYALKVARGGIRMHRSQDATCPTFRWKQKDPPADASPLDDCAAILTGPNRHLNHKLDAVGMSISPVPGHPVASTMMASGDLIDFLTWWGRLDHPVVDKTGDKGLFDFHLEWSWQTKRDASLLDEFTNPSIFTALEQELGLKLELTQGPVQVVVIDHVERPDAT